jgi:hypothetical protein
VDELRRVLHAMALGLILGSAMVAAARRRSPQ